MADGLAGAAYPYGEGRESRPLAVVDVPRFCEKLINRNLNSLEEDLYYPILRSAVENAADD
jgi:hypothetical protein